MLVRVFLWISVSCCLMLPAAPAAAQERTERDVIEAIVRDGPRARAIRSAVDVTRLEQLARLVYPNPAVIYSREGAGFTEFLQVEQQLPVFGLRSSLARAGQAGTAASEAERDALLWQLRAEAAAAVARLVAEQEHVAIADAALAEVSRLVEMIRIRAREGESSRFDLLRAEQELADARQSAVSAQVALVAARAVLRGLLPPDVPLARIASSPRAVAPLPATETLVARATTARAEIRQLRALVAQSGAEGAAARMSRRFTPTVAVGMKRAEVSANDRERGGFFGVSVPVPLFDTGSRQGARWSAEAARLDSELAAVEGAIRAEVGGALDALSVRQRAVGSLPPGTSADELARIAEVAYQEGEIGILELLDAARTTTRAQVRAIELRRDTRLAEIALERAVGEIVWP